MCGFALRQVCQDQDQDTRDGQQDLEVDAGPEAKQIGDQEELTVADRVFVAVVPTKGQPVGDDRDAHREAVDLGLAGVRPERGGEGHAQGGNNTAGQDGNSLPSVLAVEPAAEQPDDTQIHEEDGYGSRRDGKEVHAKRDLVTEERHHAEDAPKQSIEGGSRRMGHPEDVRRGDEFAAIPEGHRRRDGDKVADQGEAEDDSTNDPVQAVKRSIHAVALSGCSLR